MSGLTQCSKLHLRSNISSARATSVGGRLPQQLGGGPDDFTIAFHNYGNDKARIVFQPLNMVRAAVPRGPPPVLFGASETEAHHERRSRPCEIPTPPCSA